MDGAGFSCRVESSEWRDKIVRVESSEWRDKIVRVESSEWRDVACLFLTDLDGIKQLITLVRPLANVPIAGNALPIRER
jgi:hypothetical protein